MNKQYCHAFTLIEILIALLIFAILGTIAALALNNAITTHRQVTAVDNRLQALAITITLLRRDTQQIIDRSVIDSHGNRTPAFMSLDENSFIFTRTGLVNPMQMDKRSDLQRIAYVWRKGNLERLSWDVVDQAPNSKPQAKLLLSHVKVFSVRYLTKAGQLISMWYGKHLPRAIVITMRAQGLGVINTVLPIVARGFKLPKKVTKKKKQGAKAKKTTSNRAN